MLQFDCVCVPIIDTTALLKVITKGLPVCGTFVWSHCLCVLYDKMIGWFGVVAVPISLVLMLVDLL